MNATASAASPGPAARFSWTVWLAVSFAAFFLFLVVTWLVLATEGMKSLDRDVAGNLKEHAEEHIWLRNVLAGITRLGNRDFLTALAVIGVLAMMVRRDFLLAGVWVVAVVGGVLINGGIKSAIDRSRPPVEMRDPVEARHRSTSFPSGHSTSSPVGLGMVLFAAVRGFRRPWAKLLVAAVLIALILLICFSRMYLRAHWCSDVLGGLALGTSWLALCLGAYEWLRAGRPLRRDSSTKGPAAAK